MKQSANTAIKDIYSIKVFFLNTDSGRLFSLYVAPVSQIKGSIVFIPSFMEEMNRSRDMVAQQARKFAAIGYACLVLDLYGTGDSEGDLVNVDWSMWKKNIVSAADWLKKQNKTNVILWGLRLGCLLAVDIADQYHDRFQQLLLWQPIINGKQYLTQMLRLRMAFLLNHDRPPEKTNDMRKILQAGGDIEIAGYKLPGPLAVEMDKKKIDGFSEYRNCRIDWFENVNQVSDGFSVSVQNAIDSMEAIGVKISTHPYQSAKFWEMSDRTYAEELLEKTTRLYRDK